MLFYFTGKSETYKGIEIKESRRSPKTGRPCKTVQGYYYLLPSREEIYSFRSGYTWAPTKKEAYQEISEELEKTA